MLFNKKSLNKTEVKNIIAILHSFLESNVIKLLSKDKITSVLKNITFSNVITKTKIKNLTVFVEKLLSNEAIAKLEVTDFSATLEKIFMSNTLNKLDEKKFSSYLVNIFETPYLSKFEFFDRNNKNNSDFDISLDTVLFTNPLSPIVFKNLDGTTNIKALLEPSFQLKNFKKSEQINITTDLIPIYGGTPQKKILAYENLNKFTTPHSALYGYTASLYSDDLQFIDTNISNKIGKDFFRSQVLTKYLDPKNTDHRIEPKLCNSYTTPGKHDGLFPSGSHQETSYFGTFIGDTERISHCLIDKSWEGSGGSYGTGSAPGMRTAEYKLRQGGGSFTRGNTHHGFFEEFQYLEWDPTSHQIFGPRFRDPDNRRRTIGRTGRIDINYETGEITYPEHHYLRCWGGYLRDHLDRGTEWNGSNTYWNVVDDPEAINDARNQIIEEQYIPFDPEGQLPETSGPVWIINIADGQARSRLKVEKRGKNKGRNTK